MHHTIDPVTRIEGHAKITLRLDDAGEVADARFHVTEFRGFEEFCKGRPIAEMPGITARTCGICPVSHLLAASKAGDAILGVTPPPAALRQRRLLNLGQILQSHSLSFFHLSAPDLLLGMDHDPASRNVFGLMQAEPEIAKRGIRMRQFGQEVIRAVSGRRVHGHQIVPGGVTEVFTTEQRDVIVADIDEILSAAEATLELLISVSGRFDRELASFGDFPSLYLSHVQPDGTWEHVDGRLTMIDHDGSVVVNQFDPADYREHIGEAGKSDSYLKAPYYRARVDGDDPRPGMYRVGPLARINIAERFGTPIADQGLADFRERYGRIASSAFLYHHARVLEVIACAERIAALMDDPVLLDTRVRAQAGINANRGVGASEAPRGLLIHDYEVDDDGLITAMNLIIATGQNDLAMNATILSIAKEFVDGTELTDGMLNRIEAGVRAYDPCLSCSTHAIGQMPMKVQLLAPDGELLQEVRRD
ncbi:MAG: Ni/Fe hydrogenase subunit alpha [Nitriliruptor sp.]|nr:MAG: Ni/Fe hydrogenase subunit alpha [Nitriliruptor sp.]